MLTRLTLALLLVILSLFVVGVAVRQFAPLTRPTVSSAVTP